jgi:hypothetical protein
MGRADYFDIGTVMIESREDGDVIREGPFEQEMTERRAGCRASVSLFQLS